MGQDGYFASQTAHAAERERLTCIENGLDPISTRHLEALGVDEGWTCLEVGGGGGSIARWLADKVGAQGRVVVIDKDVRFLREIERRNLELRQGDILHDGLEERRYDLAHCRLLLPHLPEHELAISRMIAALKIGGWLLIEEADFSSYQAADAKHESISRKLREIFGRVAHAKLFDPYFGRRTSALLERAGLSELGNQGTARIWRGGDVEARAHQLSLPALVRAGVCTPEEAYDIEQALVGPGFTFVGYTLFSAWGRRAA